MSVKPGLFTQNVGMLFLYVVDELFPAVALTQCCMNKRGRCDLKELCSLDSDADYFLLQQFCCCMFCGF